MDLFKRFSDYDVFAYLPPGFIALAAIDYLFETRFVMNAGWDVPKGLLSIFGAYIVGHLIASPSAQIIEKWFVRRLVKHPATHLLTDQQSPALLRAIFTDYCKPLPKPNRQEIMDKLGCKDARSADVEALFLKAYLVAKNDERAKDRMSTFINLYGFCRNICFVAGLTAFALFVQLTWVQCWSDGPLDSERMTVAILLLMVTVIMLQRYLKFHRLYSVEVFTTFAMVEPTPPDPPDKTAG